ncbi:MAG: DUF4184 family protein [Myxococcota bacterium]|nr:DUF4184 family protein [Myxococcota bacterium]
MPFTLSHPAAILPLRPLLGRQAVLPALVIGSMAPDFPYFLGLGNVRADVHTLASVAWFSVPAGWAAYLLFHFVLRRPGVFLLPGFVRARLEPAPGLGSFVPVTVCLAVGAFTHVAWDAFTHESGAVVAQLPVLRHLHGEVAGYPVFSYKVLQHGSTLLGAAVLAWATLRWLRRTPAPPLAVEPEAVHRLRAWARVAVGVLPVLFGFAHALRNGPPVSDLTTLAWFTVWVVVSGLSMLTVLVALLAALVPAPSPVGLSAGAPRPPRRRGPGGGAHTPPS